MVTKLKTANMRAKTDPAIRYGDCYREFRVQFWQYMSLNLLEKFANIMTAGDFGKIESFAGTGKESNGKAYKFNWNPDKNLELQPANQAAGAGYIVFKGNLDFETINRIRNFPLFHLREGVEFI